MTEGVMCFYMLLSAHDLLCQAVGPLVLEANRVRLVCGCGVLWCGVELSIYYATRSYVGY